MEISKKDWKLFRDKISEWQEDYMEKLNKEYIELLNEDSPSSTKFWKLENRINNDKNKVGVCIELRKSDMIFNIITLINDGVISINDLDDFSDELRENIKVILKSYK